MRAVRFIQHTPPYAPGEVAGFPDDEAQSLVHRALAAPYGEGWPVGEETTDAGAPGAGEMQTSATPPSASDDPPPADPGPLPPDTSIHDLSVEKVKELVLGIPAAGETPAAAIRRLYALEAGERLNSKHDGGRRGALEPVQARLVELLNLGAPGAGE